MRRAGIRALTGGHASSVGVRKEPRTASAQGGVLLTSMAGAMRSGGSCMRLMGPGPWSGKDAWAVQQRRWSRPPTAHRHRGTQAVRSKCAGTLPAALALPQQRFISQQHTAQAQEAYMHGNTARPEGV